MQVKYGYHTTDNTWNCILATPNRVAVAKKLARALKIKEYTCDVERILFDGAERSFELWYRPKNLSYDCHERIIETTLLYIDGKYYELSLYPFNGK